MQRKSSLPKWLFKLMKVKGLPSSLEADWIEIKGFSPFSSSIHPPPTCLYIYCVLPPTSMPIILPLSAFNKFPNSVSPTTAGTRAHTRTRVYTHNLWRIKPCFFFGLFWRLCQKDESCFCSPLAHKDSQDDKHLKSAAYTIYAYETGVDIKLKSGAIFLQNFRKQNRKTVDQKSLVLAQYKTSEVLNESNTWNRKWCIKTVLHFYEIY